MESQETSPMTRHAGMAFLMTLVFPGLGHLYAGESKWAWGWLMLIVLSPLGASRALVSFGLGAAVLAYLLLGWSLLVVAAIHVARLIRAQADYQLQPVNEAFRYVGFAFLALGLSVGANRVHRAEIVEMYRVPSGSMAPSIMVGDHVAVNKTRSGGVLARRGEVVVLTFPDASARAHLDAQPPEMSRCVPESWFSSEVRMVKRVVGVEGDTIEIRGGALFRDDIAVPQLSLDKGEAQDVLRARETVEGHTYTVSHHKAGAFGPVRVRPGHVFVLGDRRNHSSDSRCWGQVPIESLVGRPEVVMYTSGREGWGLDRMGVLVGRRD